MVITVAYFSFKYDTKRGSTDWEIASCVKRRKVNGSIDSNVTTLDVYRRKVIMIVTHDNGDFYKQNHFGNQLKRKMQVYHISFLTIDMSEELFMKFWPEKKLNYKNHSWIFTNE